MCSNYVQVMRPHHGDEFSMTELNSVEWLVGNPPQVETMSYCLTNKW